ncbi:MAG: coproporphyrinogen dehydrogenase HemZ [Bacillota bacterium]|nr:coproporphyrinogen dehydrogenase HemZ [Bacillota bacterium]
MVVLVNVVPSEYYASIHELFRLGFPGAEIRRGVGEGNVFMEIECCEEGQQFVIKGKIEDQNVSTADRAVFDTTVKQPEINRKIELRKFAFRLLCKHLQKNINPYGILTGVRPVKTVHRFLDQGTKADELEQRMQSEYLMDKSKAQLLCEIAKNNRPYLPDNEDHQRSISIYIGIPFCPTRCYYCSFPGAILKNYEEEVPPFLEALKKELNEVGDSVKSLNLKVDAIYLGGGTPTILSEKDLEEVFSVLYEKYITEDTREITVEAGRPDTLSLKKINKLFSLGVNRICVNPQTMNDHTLKRIGRNHTSQDIVQAVDWARQVGIEEINMDLIVGLPGEGMLDLLHTTREVLKLKPTNVTVHSLAVKRGSQLAITEGLTKLESAIEMVAGGIHYLRQTLQENGFDPYYLYRQKYMKANMENIGYSLPGHYCVYNIQVMEERQTILGMGGSASSKFVCPDGWTLTNSHNAKDPITYIDSVDRLVNAKVDKLRGLN